MRDLTTHNIAIAASTDGPKGIAFEIDDLLLVKGWADLHDVRIAVQLDHSTENEEYEEIIAFHSDMGSRCQLMMWRDATAVFLQPLPGRRQRHESVSRALGSLVPKEGIVSSDIIATEWPGG